MVWNFTPVPMGRIKLYVWSLLCTVFFTNVLFAQADVTKPKVVSSSPTLLSLDAGTSIDATFSEAMNVSTINTTTVELRNALTGALTSAAVYYNASTNTVKLFPTSPLLSLLYTAKVKGGSAGVKDLAGNPMASDYSWSFLIVPLYDFTAPIVLATTPSNGATSQASSTQPSATFSEAMNASTIKAATVELRNASNALVPATVSYNSSLRKATLVPNAPLAAGVYKATIKGGSSGVKDLFGNALSSNYQWSFTVGAPAPADVTPPQVSSVSPLNNAINQPVAVNATAMFNEAMNAGSINTTTVQIFKGATQVAAAVSYNATTKTVTLDPTASLAYSTAYTVKIKGGAAGVKDVAGNALVSDYTWTFTTVAPPDVTPPTVTSVTPANNATNQAITVSPTAVFSEALNASTVNSSTVQILKGTTVVAAAISYDATTRMVTIDPTASLAKSTIYTVKIKGGPAGVKDLAGNALVGEYTWKFTTGTSSDVTPPGVSSVSPANNAVNVAITVNATAVFNEVMNASTINGTTVLLFKGASQVSASVTYNATNRTVTLDPTASLANSTVYTVRIKGGAAGVKDAAGNAMVSDYTWNFTTVSPVDVTPPTITEVSPEDGADHVAVNTTITGEFSETMNASTINGSTVQLLDGTTPVAASVSYHAASRTFTLTPSAPLSNVTTYTVIVKGGASGVKDVAGNALAGDYTWSFTTKGVSLFGPEDLPVVPLITDNPVELGMKFRSSETGFVKGVRFYKAPGNNGTHIGHLWDMAGTQLAEAVFENETASGWQEVMFDQPVAIAANTTYVVSYYSPLGMYGYTNSYFTAPVTNGPLTALGDGEDGGNGVYKYSSAPIFPTDSYLSSNYYTDIVFAPGPIPDDIPPTVVQVSPYDGATTVSTKSKITAVFSEAMSPLSINSFSVSVRTSSGTPVSATVTYNGPANSVIITPTSPLANGTTYVATIKGGESGVKDALGNHLEEDYDWPFTTAEPLINPSEGPGGPILVVSTASNPFSRYAVEILRAEGLNEFAASDITAVNATMLNNYDVVILGEMTLTSAHVTMFTNWVNAGGTLIAFKPSSLLNSLFGLSASTGTLSDKYLLVNTTSGPGVGIVNQTIQYHGSANLHSIVGGSGAFSLATLYSNATTATSYPAVVMRHVGVHGGSAVAFTYDLAKSVVYTRQGNPAWAGQERDGESGPIRSNDLFFGTNGDAHWIDFNKIAIPQADEQQRLLANIILQNNLHRKPLPRFWYLPRDLKAAIVMTGDDHAVNGTSDRFEHFKSLGPNSPADVADWTAVRGTSYIYPNTPLSNLEAMNLQAEGFELALHPHTNCENYTPASLADAFSSQLASFRSAYPGVAPVVTNRTHCLVWSDWSSTPKVEYQNGMRLDVTYYNWPESWMQNIPGMFTGSGMPMRFADLDGSIIDVYQAPTQMTDETNMNYAAFCNALLDKAVGPEGYYGVFTANMHTDQPGSEAAADAIIASAQARGVPVISAQQLLKWLDARNGSSFTNMTWVNSKLYFKVNARMAAKHLKVMLPYNAGSGQLLSVTQNGTSLPFTVETIKGIQYAFFAVLPGSHDYVADYSGAMRTNTAEPTITQSKATGVSETDEKGETPAVDALYIKAMPNPSVGYFNIVINSNEATPVTVRILDITGRVVEVHQKLAYSGILRVGHNWGAGSYFAEVMQGNQRKVVKLVKVN